MGEVWLVQHEVFRATRALKLLKPAFGMIDNDLAERMKREARVMKRLSYHPHAVIVHDAAVDIDQNVAYIDMDFIPGRSVDKLLEPGKPMPLEWTTQVLDQLCDVLQQAHDHGIVHRDLSPSNLVLEDRPDGQVHLRVLDFGIAKVLEPESCISDTSPTTEADRFLGKPTYASPEQFQGNPIDGRSDLYTVGVLLYEFLTGKRPFQGSRVSLAYDHCNTPPTRFAEASRGVRVPEEVERVVLRCLAKEPDERPQSPRALIDEWHRAARTPLALIHRWTGVAVPLEPEPPVPEPTWLDWLAKKSAILGVTIIGCLALLVLTYVVYPRRPDGPPPSPPPIRPQVIAFLEHHGFERVEGSEVAPGGLPTRVARSADRREFGWHQGVYLPAGYEPDPEKGKVGVLPLVLVSKGGSRFLLIKGQEFAMGAFDPQISDFTPEEKPGHLVRLSSFYIKETEVTFGEFDRFCEETKRGRNDPDLKESYYYAWVEQRQKMTEDELRGHPAVNIKRKLAEAYSHHGGGDLPSEAQWEYAARSQGKKQLYVWGANSFPRNVNIHKPIVVGIETLPVGLSTDDRTEQGVLDLAGNVREWCRDVWKIYPRIEPALDPVQGASSDEPNPAYAIRGGSYSTPTETARATWRSDLPGAESLAYRAKNDDYALDLGFRVVLEILEIPEDLIAGSEFKGGPRQERAP
jgi:serine/threonine-protein kinase